MDASDLAPWPCDDALRGDALVKAGATWRDHTIPSRWPEKVDRKTHPHAKPAGLIARLIGAVTAPGDLVVDPAAGSFIVMSLANDMGRSFVGCDIVCQPPHRDHACQDVCREADCGIAARVWP